MVSFYGTGYAGLLLYITRKQTAVNGRIYGYTAYHKSKKVTSEGRVYFGTDPEWRGILLCSDTPEHPFLCPLPSTLPRVGGKVQFQLGLYAVTVSTAQRHPYDGYRTRTVVT